MFYQLAKASRFLILTLIVVTLFNPQCATRKISETPRKPKNTYLLTDRSFTGMSSWYGGRFNGRKTANGERFNMNELTAAHKTLPFGTLLKVTNLETQKSVIVRINDRGPYHGRRVLDLSFGAAQKIGLAQSGVAMVEARVVEKKQGKIKNRKYSQIAAGKVIGREIRAD